MDGLSLDGIMGMLREFMPTISYILNLVTKMFDIFTSYMGFGVFTPEEEAPENEGGAAEGAIV